MAVFKVLAPGDPAPWFRARSLARPDFAFDTVAGRYLVLGFFGAATDPLAQVALRDTAERVLEPNEPAFEGVEPTWHRSRSCR